MKRNKPPTEAALEASLVILAWIAAVVSFVLALISSALTYITFAYTRFPSDMIYGPIWTAGFWIAFAICFAVARRR